MTAVFDRRELDLGCRVGAFSRPFSGTWRLPAENVLDPTQIGLIRASMTYFWPRLGTFGRDGSLFDAQLPLRNRRYFHDLVDGLRALASPSTFSKGGPLQPIAMTGFAEVSKDGPSKPSDSSS